jgi:bifunctional non-homologous end joining protein LigD
MRRRLAESLLDALLYLDGHDLRNLPLRRRKEILLKIVDLPNVRVSEHIEQHGRAFYQVVAQQGLEGIVAKDGRSKYATGRRSNSWYKIKARRRDAGPGPGKSDSSGWRLAPPLHSGRVNARPTRPVNILISPLGTAG